MAVGPHPHIGLHTVTWLLQGEVEHSDSLGNQQLIRPGQLNLMTAGGGISHAEDARQQSTGAMDGVQLWVAQPERTRHGAPSFAHLEVLPEVTIEHASATVLVGDFAATRSPAPTDSPMVGVDISCDGRALLPLEPTFEYAVAGLQDHTRMLDVTVQADQLAYIGSGRQELLVDCHPGSRFLLLGGAPFEEIVMWWNFVARSREELETAYQDWASQHERFGSVQSTLPRIEAPRPFWI
jgi:hypothetical protein